eukprot:CAMPEP_0176076980 /NCGR_PEP_ID=MMETSP0120_2-20121206/38488_1 /TAXON_ID=160619 /ORGANISM="Kryptoperidinium foliaceum, Strain CCMP 1326" /LENGTH=147 /DNA_ID=CAMNT_0017410709 /DNA_START=91 /DNA_END=534 /DNA_ORIENTATION=+
MQDEEFDGDLWDYSLYFAGGTSRSTRPIEMPKLDLVEANKLMDQQASDSWFLRRCGVERPTETQRVASRSTSAKPKKESKKAKARSETNVDRARTCASCRSCDMSAMICEDADSAEEMRVQNVHDDSLFFGYGVGGGSKRRQKGFSL